MNKTPKLNQDFMVFLCFLKKFSFLFWDRVSLCSPHWVEFIDPPVSASWLLGLEAWATTAWLGISFFFRCGWCFLKWPHRYPGASSAHIFLEENWCHELPFHSLVLVGTFKVRFMGTSAELHFRLGIGALMGTTKANQNKPPGLSSQRKRT